MEHLKFSHECVTEGCDIVVEMDDEPWCFKHARSIDKALVGYSARRAAEMRKNADTVMSHVVSRNVFEENPEGDIPKT